MAAWGVLAAGASLLFSAWRSLPEWRIFYLRWRSREVTADDIAATQGYRPHPPEPVEDALLHSLILGVAAALWVWAGDYPGREGEAVRKLVEALLIALVLLWSYRKPRGEVGAPPEEGPKKGSRPSWWTVLALLAIAAIAWFDPLADPRVWRVALPGAAGAIVAAGGLWLWHRANTPDELREPLFPEATIPRDAVLGFLAAVAIVIFLLGLFTTLAI